MEKLLTGKPHISFSELKMWLECGWHHKLVHIDKLSAFEPSIYSDFGTIIHDASEGYLRTRTFDKEATFQRVRDIWEERGYPNVDTWPPYKSAVPELQYWIDCADSMIDSIPKFMEEQYPNWEFVEAEEQLMEPIVGSKNLFKGFIDAIIKVPRKNGTFKYYIIDWKTAPPGGWRPQKKRDFKMQLQLVLYKQFWSDKHNIPIKDIQCAFILLRRIDPKSRKKAGNKCSIVKVSAGPKTLERGQKYIRNMFAAQKRRSFLKNKFACQFCEFSETEHCKQNM
tara:strand:- start:290 stop:1132 length:843 start_codon:yes stop_codon:yes gene_type:complete